MGKSTVLIGKGSSLSYDTATTDTANLGTATWTKIAEVVDVEPPGLEVGDEDTTHLDSDNVEMTPQLPDPGEISGTMHFLPANLSALLALVGKQPDYAFQVETKDRAGVPDGAYQFLGYLKSFKPQSLTSQGKRTATFVIRRNTLTTVVTP